MDALAKLIQKRRVDVEKKKQKVIGQSSGRKFVRRGEIKRMEEEEYDEEERRRRASKRRRDVGAEVVKKKQKMSGGHDDGDDDKKKESEVIAKDEVILRLRKAGEPVTLFGESDRSRQTRLEELEEKTRLSLIGDNEDMALTGGHKGRNVFLDNSKDDDDDSNVESKRKKKKRKKKKQYEDDSDKPTDRQCYNFFKRMLREWKEILEMRPDEIKRSVRGKIATKTHKQCKDYMRPFLKMCKAHTVKADILKKVHEIVQLCKEREYVKAHSVYMDLAIGRAAWPIGATSVGIHERAARERIQENKIAHVMNDETSRKYMTSIKRLMTFCQTTYPTDPSKMVMN